jgi:hypothetical protein
LLSWLYWWWGAGAVAAFANAANPDYQIYDESPDGRFGFRDSFAGTAKTEESDTDLVSAAMLGSTNVIAV